MTVWRVLRGIGVGVMLGVGTIFSPKTRDDDHWSASPKVQIVEEAEGEQSGDPPLPGGRRLPNAS